MSRRGDASTDESFLEFVGQRRSADSELSELGPGKFRTRIDLTTDRDVRMGDDVPWLDIVTTDDFGAQGEDDVRLGIRIRINVPVVVDDLNANGMLVKAIEVTPGALTGVESSLVLGDHPDDPRLGFIGDDIVNPDTVLGIFALQDVQRGGQGACGMVQDQDGHRAAAWFASQRGRTLFDRQSREGRLFLNLRRKLSFRCGRATAEKSRKCRINRHLAAI